MPLSKACDAGCRTEYSVEFTGSNSILLSTGAFVFQQPLLSISSIGTGSFSFGLNYTAGQFGSRALGIGFQYAQNVRVSRFDDGDVILDSGNFTTETFTYDSDSGTYSSVANNTAAELRVEFAGTADEQYILSGSDGRVTTFFGFYETIATPGQIKTFADRYGNMMTFTWEAVDSIFQLTQVTDSYGRTIQYRYYGSDGFYRLRELEDFLGRTITFQYDSAGRLVAVITPEITKAAPGNEKPYGTAYVFQYDTGNPRQARRNDLIRIWYPNQATAFINLDDDGQRSVDIAAVQQQATPRYSVEYGQDPNQYNTWGKVLRETIGDPNPANGVGGMEDPLRRDRYERLTRLINGVISNPKGTRYLILPELSMPSCWFMRFADKLQRCGISLITGIEYLHNDLCVHNQVWAALLHDGLGFPSLMIYRQDKQRPALHEEEKLHRLAGREMQPDIPWQKPPIIQHGDFRFALLICSELTNIHYRAALRGKVDALFVPEWNPDTETFNALVESAALDIHAYIIQCNDRQYGDSRIRAPFKDSWQRDLLRVKGGVTDYCVIGEIDVKALRQFQSSHRSPAGPFKPVPDGFEIEHGRKVLPGGDVT